MKIGNGKDVVKTLARYLIFSTPVSAYLARRIFLGRRGFKKRMDPETLFLINLGFHGKVVFDIGCSVGEFTQFFAESVGRKGSVVAFEPNPKAYQNLKARIGRTIDFNVLAENMAVGAEPGTCHMCVRNNDTGTGSIEEHIKGQIISEGDYYELNVTMCSLDSSLCANEGETLTP